MIQFYIIVWDMAKKTNFKVIGLDEAGRGPLAGPVVAAAVRIKGRREVFQSFENEIKDSKKLTSQKRERLYEELVQSKQIEKGVGVVFPELIDKINILEATKLAMKNALINFEHRESILLIDGNFKINLDWRQKAVIRGDETILECSFASVIAKVERDRIMLDYHKKYPFYGFIRNKGYGTEEHRRAILRHGICPIHRRSFIDKNKKKWDLSL
jgi:ribonuclease HII